MPSAEPFAFVALALSLVLLAAPGLQAQSSGTAERTGATSAIRSPSWSVGFSAEERWDSNPRFLQPGDPDDFMHRVSATASRSWFGRRSQANLSVAGDASRFGVYKDLNRATYRGALDVSRRLSRTLAWRSTFATQQSLAGDLALRDDPGIALPRVLARSQSAATQFDTRLSKRTTASFAGYFDRVTFNGSLLPDGWSVTQRTSLGRRTSKRTSLGALLEVSRATSEAQDGSTQTVLATFDQAITAHIAARIGVGALRLDRLGADQARIQPSGNAEIRGSSARGTQSFLIRFDRSATQAFGFGRILATNHAHATFDRTLGRWIATGVRASYASSRDPNGRDFNVTSQDYGLDVRVRLRRDLGLQIDNSIRSRNQQGNVTSGAVALSLSYAARFR